MESINISEVVISNNDWTIETILNQLVRKNIQIEPNSPRRDVWNLVTKSRFIESIILGLPISQIVLAAYGRERWKYIVVDGNQRLLSLLEFYGRSETENNSFSLTGLDFRTELNGCNYQSIEKNISINSVLTNLDNQTIRVFKIQNLSDESLLDNIYSRLN